MSIEKNLISTRCAKSANWRNLILSAQDGLAELQFTNLNVQNFIISYWYSVHFLFISFKIIEMFDSK